MNGVPNMFRSPQSSNIVNYTHLKFTFHDRLGPLEMMKEQAGELKNLGFVTDLKIGTSMYTGYINADGQKHGLGEELLETTDVYEGEFKNGT